MTASSVPLPLTVERPKNSVSWFRQCGILLSLQFSDYRESAPLLVVFSIAMPLGILWILNINLSSAGTGGSWFLAGNTVMAIAFGSTTFAVYRLGSMRIQRQMDYYATLPVRRSAFLVSLFLLAQFSALPGAFTSLIVGLFLYGLPLTKLGVAVPLALLAAASLTVVGAALGSMARTMGQVSLYTNFVYIAVMFLSPVLVPAERLPAPLRVTAMLLPTGQAASALRDSLQGNYGSHFWFQFGALLLWLLVAAVFGLRRLDWRGD